MRKGGVFSISYEEEHLKITMSNSRRTTIHSRIQRNSGILRNLFRLYVDFLFPDLRIIPAVLSAERFGISLFYKELDSTKNQLVNMLQKMGDRKSLSRIDLLELVHAASSRYALPVGDNINFTRSISDVIEKNSEMHEDGIFEGVEDIMCGHYEISNDDIQFVFSPSDDPLLKIPLHRASSSARELSDLYFFLRHVARKDHLLIIDEPESHLDTMNQILMARLIARAVRHGLKILVTTHSDYIVKEINNLIMLSNFGDDVAKEVGYSSADRIGADRVRAYIAENGGLTKCKIDRFGMEMPIFDNTIDKINQVANDLGSRLVVDQDD